MRILLTGGGGAGMEALWRLFPVDKYDLYFHDDDPRAFDPTLPQSRCISDRSVWSCLNEFDLTVLGVDEQLWMAHSPAAAVGRILVPDVSYIEQMRDKAGLVDILAEAGFRVPATHVVKPRFGRGSRDVRVIQERLRGQEYTVTICADRQARLRAIVPVRVDKKRGVTLRGVTEAQPIVMDTCRRLHAAFPTRGTYNVQGVLLNDGQFGIFEINPRVSTTLCLVVAAGVDPIECFLADDDNTRDDPIRLLPFCGDLTLRRNWRNHII